MPNEIRDKEQEEAVDFSLHNWLPIAEKTIRLLEQEGVRPHLLGAHLQLALCVEAIANNISLEEVKECLDEAYEFVKSRCITDEAKN